MSSVVNAVVSILYTSSKDFGEDSGFYKDLRSLSEKHGVAILFGKQENSKDAEPVIDTKEVVSPKVSNAFMKAAIEHLEDPFADNMAASIEKEMNSGKFINTFPYVYVMIERNSELGFTKVVSSYFDATTANSDEVYLNNKSISHGSNSWFRVFKVNLPIKQDKENPVSPVSFGEASCDMKRPEGTRI